MKKRVIKDYNSLPGEIREEIRKRYPQGHLNHIITIFDRDKNLISAVPLETKDIDYLIKMPSAMHLDEEEETPSDSIEEIPKVESIDGLDEEGFLIQEEKEESD